MKKDRAIGKNKNHESSNYPLYRIMRKHGIDNFDFSIMEECPKDRLNQRENFWIEHYDCIAPKGYNQTINKIGNSAGGHFSKFDDKKVEEIVNKLQRTLESMESIARTYDVSLNTISAINTGKTLYSDRIKYPLRVTTKKEYCKQCGREISHGTKNKLWATCFTKNSRTVDRPTRNELKILIRTKPFTKIAEQFGVTDNAVRRWCDSYNLPRKKRDIDKYSDLEWLLI